MCPPPNKRELFFVRGRQKGWDDERTLRAWEFQAARADVEELLSGPEPLKVGDKVNLKPSANINYVPTAGSQILLVDGIEAWVKLPCGDRHTVALCNLDRVQ